MTLIFGSLVTLIFGSLLTLLVGSLRQLSDMSGVEESHCMLLRF